MRIVNEGASKFMASDDNTVMLPLGDPLIDVLTNAKTLDRATLEKIIVDSGLLIDEKVSDENLFWMAMSCVQRAWYLANSVDPKLLNDVEEAYVARVKKYNVRFREKTGVKPPDPAEPVKREVPPKRSAALPTEQDPTPTPEPEAKPAPRAATPRSGKLESRRFKAAPEPEVGKLTDAPAFARIVYQVFINSPEKVFSFTDVLDEALRLRGAPFGNESAGRKHVAWWLNRLLEKGLIEEAK